MQEVKKVINRDEQITTSDGAVVTEHTERVNAEVDSKVTITNVIWYVYGLIAIILASRFILKLAGANAGNAFVNFIYNVSGVLTAPFDTIFGVTKSSAGNTTSVFEPSILVAIAVYGLIAWGICKLLLVNEPKE